ncbi:NAD(P)/FAD-dependent oxidoreductase [Thalassotalea piscium]
MKHIVILGAGIGGLPAAFELRHKLGDKYKITVINKDDYFQFVPSNPWVAIGWRERETITEPIAPILKKLDINFIGQAAETIDAKGNKIILADKQELQYDYLIITTGPSLAFDDIPGAGPNAFTQSICTVNHAQQAFEAYQEFLKNPGPIVVGAMPGASCFGPGYEFAFILDTDLRRRKIRNKVPITFVTSEPYIGHMGLGGVGDSKSLLESEFRERDIRWITNAKTTSVEENMLHCEELNRKGEVEFTHDLPFELAMMLPSFKGVDAVANVEGLCNPRGFVIIDEYQRNPTFKNIFSAGVCVAIPPIEQTPVPTGAPKTGYMIESMVTAIIENIAADIAGEPATARATWNAICLADMGDSGAAFVALPQIPPRNTTWFSKGKWVHLAKIAFEKYFLYKIRHGSISPIYEKYVLKTLGIVHLLDPEEKDKKSE